jgi:Skp family chaperone for outer membrane proteins
MNQSRTMMLMLGCGLAGLLLGFSRSAEGPVVVVDVVAAIEASDAWSQEEARLVELAQQLQSQAETLKDEITTIQNDLQSGILTPDSPERMRLEDQLLEKANAFRAMQRTIDFRLNSENARILEQLHALAQRAMASLSAERGWSVVLPRTPVTVPESLDPNIVRSAILDQSVLHAEPVADVTSIVTNRMNEL